MRILTNLLKPLLIEGRVFVAQGTTDINRTTDGLATDYIRVQPGIELEPYTTFWGRSGAHLVSMGAFSYTNSRLPFDISVGRYTSIAVGLRVMGDAHPATWASTSPVFYNHKTLIRTFCEDNGVKLVPQPFTHNRGKISIGSDVWIGENVTLGHGIAIGDGAIIASNATVTKDVDPYTIVGGVPAVARKMRFDDSAIEYLKASRWWRFSPDSLKGLDMSEPVKFAHAVLERENAGNIIPFEPGALTHKEFAELG